MALAAIVLLSGCMSWPRGWEVVPDLGAAQATDLEASIEAAAEAFESAGSAEELDTARTRIGELLEQVPNHKRLLLVGAQAEILHGAAYDQRKSDKAESYIRGIQYAERVMATHPEVRRQLEAGATLAESVQHLESDRAEAMLLWVTGVSYYFKECLSGLGHLVNFRWMLQTSEVMKHLNAVAPDYKYGAVPFSLGIYYLALPESAGGDIQLAGQLLQKAVDQSGTSLLPRWGRAKYYWVKIGDEQAFRDDLEAVLAMDPQNAISAYSWNVYFQRDAREMLEQAEALF